MPTSNLNRKNSALFSILVCILAGPGCDKSSETTPQGAQSEATDIESAEEASKESASDATGTKISGYIECINEHSERMSYARGQYFKMFKDADAGPTNCKKVRGTPGTTYDPSGCMEAVTKAATMSPKLPALEKAGTDFASAMSALFKPNEKIYTYYNQGDHNDDSCAHGVEMHPKLVQLWSTYGQAENTFRIELDKVTDKLALDRVTALEKKHGTDDVRFLHRKIMLESLTLLRLYERQVKAESFDEELIKSQATALADTIDKLGTVVEQNEEAAEALIDGVARFAKRALDYRKEIKEFMRETKPKKRKDILQDVIKEYNSLIEESNRLKFAR